MIMALNLVKPIIFFDLETTGVDISKDRIVEISFIKVFPDGREMEYSKRINPEMHIPEGASAVHGIYDEDVKECPTFKEVARVIANEFEGCDVAGFNSNRFDLPLLAEEFCVLRWILTCRALGRWMCRCSITDASHVRCRQRTGSIVARSLTMRIVRLPTHVPHIMC